MFQKISIILLCILFTLLPFKGPCLQAQTSIIDQILKVQPAIVSIQASNRGWFKSPRDSLVRDPRTGRLLRYRKAAMASYQRGGAGVVIHPSGVIVTNAHTITKADTIKVIFHDKTAVPAQVARFIKNLDFALLKINPPFPLKVIPIADSDKIHLGDEIITVGNSKLLKQTLSGGKIIGIGTNRSQQSKGNAQTDLIQTTITLYEGDSGGPLFDRQGRLIGLMTAQETSRGHSSFAIPSNKIKKYLIEYLNETKP